MIGSYGGATTVYLYGSAYLYIIYYTVRVGISIYQRSEPQTGVATKMQGHVPAFMELTL